MPESISDLEKRSVEAKVVYQDAESKGGEGEELHRQLKNRHAQMISIGELAARPVSTHANNILRRRHRYR